MRCLIFVLCMIGLLLAGCSGSISDGQPIAPDQASSVDPFGAPPLPSEFNCGPEERYKFDTTISSEQDFVDFLEGNSISDWVVLDSFKDEDGSISWERVLSEVKKDRIGGRTVYSLVYVPYDCDEYTVKMTDDGHVSVYGCCGK